MKAIEIVKKLISFSPRQFEGEETARNYISGMLSENDIIFTLQNFPVTVPIFKDFYLRADGKEIECLPTCFKSGKISKKSDIISSLVFSYEGSGRSNINYNPHCDCISLANFYDSPSIAVSRKDSERIMNAKSLDGSVEVNKKRYSSCNILAGNIRSPKNIVFAHYDCFFDGAIDNASGVSVCISIILDNREVLKDNLFVFCGSEELSFDKPNYWGKCFRVFECKNRRAMKIAKKIIIVDCVGTDEPEVKKYKQAISLFFAKSKNNKNKISVITSVERRPREFMKVYHSKRDVVGGVREKYLRLAARKCLNLIK
ncbi:MAG: hypothetical protein WA063_04335 [Minisyncoccia bacterium]